MVRACAAARGAVLGAERATQFAQEQGQDHPPLHQKIVVVEVVGVVVEDVGPGRRGRRVGGLYQRALSPTVHSRSCGGPIQAMEIEMCWGRWQSW